MGLFDFLFNSDTSDDGLTEDERSHLDEGYEPNNFEEDETEDGDVSDTQLGNLKDLSTELPVNVVISQYSGETLEEYQWNY